MSSAALEGEGIASSPVDSGGVRLEVAWAGPESGPPAILLHGFPESSRGWRHQVGPLAGAGLRLVIPDQRGYAASGRPAGLDAYSLDALAVDVLTLIDATGRDRAALVGHDWGGLVAWWVALRHPERVERLAVLNAPHPLAFRNRLARRPSQLFKSWYVFLFQVPGLPERLLRRRGFRMLERALTATSRPGTFSEPDLEGYRRDWSHPGALRSMIAWYRAALRRRPPDPDDPRVRVPTLILWGPGDRFLDRALADESLALCDRGRLEWIEGATHWLQHEEPGRVNRLLIDFLAGAGPADRVPSR